MSTLWKPDLSWWDLHAMVVGWETGILLLTLEVRVVMGDQLSPGGIHAQDIMR